MIFFAWYSLDFNSISDWRITSPRCYPADKWSSTEFRKWKRQEGEKTSRSRFTRHERNGNDIIRFFFFSFAWKKRSRIVDIFLVFEFQPSVFSCRGLLRSKGWTTRNRVLISSVNLLIRLRPENSPKTIGRTRKLHQTRNSQDNCSDICLSPAKRYPRLLLFLPDVRVSATICRRLQENAGNSRFLERKRHEDFLGNKSVHFRFKNDSLDIARKLTDQVNEENNPTIFFF